MIYLIALFLPPLAALFTGRPFAAFALFILWLLAWAFLLVIGHIFVVLLTWIVISSARADRRHKALIKAVKERG